MSLTHGTGSARTHIWTFAAGFTENGDSSFGGEQWPWVTLCPCEQNAQRHHLSATITSVRVLILAQISMAWDEPSFLMILCGMARTAYPLARAASSTVLRGSQRPYPTQPRTILNYESVSKDQVCMKVLQLD